MDIKNAINAALPITTRTVDSSKRAAIKSDTTHERDANGQQQYSNGQQHPNRPMSEEELEKALDHLRNLAVVKDHNLEVELLLFGTKKFVVLKEPNGKVIRRIPESELWSLQIMKDSDRGQLIHKTA